MLLCVVANEGFGSRDCLRIMVVAKTKEHMPSYALCVSHLHAGTLVASEVYERALPIALYNILPFRLGFICRPGNTDTCTVMYVATYHSLQCM